MKAIPKEKSSALFNNPNGYYVIGYCKGNYEYGKEVKYFILDDDFIIHSFSKDRLTLLTEGNIDFVNVYETDYIKIFMDKEFRLVYEKSLLKNENLDFNFEIWDRTWLAFSLNKKGIELNEELNYILTDENHKINYLNGFLDFATDYMNFDKDCDAHYEISFYKTDINKSRLRFETEYFKSIDNDENTIIEKIEDYLFKGEKIENFDGKISFLNSRKIFLLIDSIIAKENYSVYEYYNGYKSSKIIFENKETYYLLNFDESD